MKKNLARRIGATLAVLTLLAAGYVGMQLAPTIHATSDTHHGQMITYDCPSAGSHCL